MKPDDLQDLAARIRYVADRYEHIAAEMKRRGIPALLIKGIDTIVDEVIPNRLGANAGSAERALQRWNGPVEYKTDQQPLNLVAEAEATHRKVAARKKKKSS